MREYCANTAALNAYMAQQDRQDRRENALRREEARLVSKGGDYYPWTAANIQEAGHEVFGNLSVVGAAAIAQCFESGDDMAAGRAIRSLIESYWDDLAEQNAPDNLCSWCGGTGCGECR